MRSALGATGLVLVVTFAASSPAAAGNLIPQIDQALDAWKSGEIAQFPLGLHRIEIAPGEFRAVKGIKERREVRHARWAALLEGDRARVLEEEGYPAYRYRETAMGQSAEYWIYPGRGIVYVFRDGALVDVRPS
jgi:hypothetical protein